ncbi:MAG: ABC transporter permease [Clostridiales bacterium]|nr:ABC transporter permease [Clostridiales bacterium]
MRSLTVLRLLTARNMKLYFKDKMTFFMSLLSPLILLVLFVTFLKSVYVSSFNAFIPEGFQVSGQAIDAFTGGWLMSSILGVSSVTVAFCSNIIMVDDKIKGSINDLLVSPVRRDLLAVSYYIANLVTTLIVCLIAMGVGFLYLSAVGWYLSVSDVLFILLDLFLCILFGTALAALVEQFLSTQGGVSAVATLVSSMYGFLCGAYMPISQFAAPIRNFVAFIPGTYGTALLRGHYMNGVLETLEGDLPAELLDGLRDSFDSRLYFFGHQVETWQMYAVLAGSVAALLGLYVLISWRRNRKVR